eukprot:6504890-Prymnesium_polylepis.1
MKSTCVIVLSLSRANAKFLRWMSRRLFGDVQCAVSIGKRTGFRSARPAKRGSSSKDVSAAGSIDERLFRCITESHPTNAWMLSSSSSMISSLEYTAAETTRWTLTALTACRKKDIGPRWHELPAGCTAELESSQLLSLVA